MKLSELEFKGEGHSFFTVFFVVVLVVKWSSGIGILHLS